MMMRLLATATVCAAAYVVLAGQQSTGGKAPAQNPPKQPDAQAPAGDGMQDMMPGPIHAHMKQCVGEFTTKTKMVGPGMPPDESTGTAKITMTLDGRFIVTEEEGSMMGMPVKSMKVAGYNNGAKRFEAVWMYTMSTGMLTMTGKSDDHGKTINWTGTYKEGDGEHTLLVTMTHVDENTFIEKIHHADGAEDGPVMETTFTRKK